jgi:hypothetical protein
MNIKFLEHEERGKEMIKHIRSNAVRLPLREPLHPNPKLIHPNKPLNPSPFFLLRSKPIQHHQVPQMSHHHLAQSLSFQCIAGLWGSFCTSRRKARVLVLRGTSRPVCGTVRDSIGCFEIFHVHAWV